MCRITLIQRRSSNPENLNKKVNLEEASNNAMSLKCLIYMGSLWTQLLANTERNDHQAMC